jgi:phosphate uptake regulator
VELEGMHETAAASLSSALDALDSKDIAAANAVVDSAQRVGREREKILRELATKRGRLAVGLAYVLESLERSAFYASDLAEIAINHAVENRASESPPASPSRKADARPATPAGSA